MHRLLLLLLLGFPAFGQFVFGVKGGVPLSDAFDIARAPSPAREFSSATRRYTIGPTAELRLPFGLGVEFDALYKRLGYTSSGSTASLTFHSETTANSWEFPLLVKYRAPGVLARPFLLGGVSFHRLSDVKQFTVETFQTVTGDRTSTTSDPEELRDKSDQGFVLGAGLELRPPVIRISPEIRYTRWGSENFLDALNILRSNKNQWEFLIGLTF